MLKTIYSMEKKSIRRSAIYIGYLAVIFIIVAIDIFFRYKFLDKVATPYYAICYTEGVEFAFFVATFSLAVLIATKKNALAQLTFTDTGCVFAGKYISAISLTIPICIYPFIRCFIDGVYSDIGFDYTLFATIECTLLYIIIIIVSLTLGFVLGYLFQSTLAVLLSVPTVAIFSVLSKHIVNFFFPFASDDSMVQSLLSTNQLYTLSTQAVINAEPRIDLVFIVKFICMISGCAALIALIYAIIKREKRKTAFTVGSIFAIGCIISGIIFANLFPTKYEYSKTALLYPESESATGDTVLECTGDIDLKEWSSFSLEISAKDTDGDGKITFALDKGFDISSLLQNGQKISFVRDGQNVVCDATLSDDSATLTVCYKGRPFYYTGLYLIPSIFTGSRFTALPVGFAFVPLGSADFKTKYDLTVYSKNTVISNLDIDSDFGQTISSKPYRLTGKSSTLSIFSGYFKSFEKDGKTVYCPKYDKLNNYEEKFEQAFTLPKRNYLSQEDNVEKYSTEMTQQEKENCKKVFFIYYEYENNSFPCIFDDALYKHYGYNAM